ncbi:MAG: carbohydrate porin [Sulfurimicrobium sp.]|nr:carbohydrate porin [Sulfurimicrobium sp.]
MFRRKIIASGIALMLGAPLSAFAADGADMLQIRNEIKALRQSYEARIEALEQRLQRAEAMAGKAENRAAQLEPIATQATASTPSNAANAFNPAIALILSGTYANLSQDPADYRISGFIPGGEIAPGTRGFSLAESELVVSANIDPNFYGYLTLALSPENTLGVEEAAIQTTTLGHGLSAKAGRFYSGIGYLNEQHPHAWDFVDAPLAYKAFLGRQYGNDGVQLKWIAPTDTFVELGAEAGRGSNFPGSERNKNGIGSYALFAHAGDDIGTDHSWRAGISWLHNTAKARAYDDLDIAGNPVSNALDGGSKLWLADFVWKWAPNGNVADRNFKLQGEYFRRQENGDLTFDTAFANSIDRYSATQTGWYLQGVYQFMPHWRVGLRADRLDSGTVDYGAVNSANLSAPVYNPSRNSLMFDYSPSEYSRLRLQLAQDKSRQGVTDNQLFLQYIMSLGAHGAHKF